MADESIFQKIGNLIVDYAPEAGGILAATGVGAPIGAALGILGSLGKALGLGSKATPEDVHQVLQANPEMAAKAYIAELDYKLNMRKADIDEIRAKEEAYIEELRAKTIPWIDGVHKIGRQILNAITIIGTFVAMAFGHNITPTEVALLTGGNIAYQLIKGKGRSTE